MMGCNKCRYFQKEKYKDKNHFREYGCLKNETIPLSIPIENGIALDHYLKACGCSDYEEEPQQMTIFDFIEGD